MLAHHSVTGAVLEALGYSSRHHPDNPKSHEERQEEKQDEEGIAGELESIRVDGNEGRGVQGAVDMFSQRSSNSAGNDSIRS